MPAPPLPTHAVQPRPTALPDLNRPRALRDEPHFVTEDDMLRMAATALTITTALATTACGSTSDADRVRAATTGWMQAIADGDGERACALLTDHARRDLADQALSTQPCAGTIADVARALSDAEREALPRMQVHRVIFAENHTKAIIEDADVTLPDALQPDDNDRPTILLKDQHDGRWRLEDLG